MADPIDPAYRQQMNDLAKWLDTRFNGQPPVPPRVHNRKIGFALFMFEFGKVEGGQVNYISNGERADMIAAVKEWLARAEGRYHEGSERQQ